ncbi:MAG: transcription antitermination factor NusB, partial [Bacteroidales bacterium]
MLNRRFIREKLVQSLYSFYQGGSETYQTSEKNMLYGIQKLYELYILHFSLLVTLSDFAKKRTEDGKLKHIPSKEDLNPNTRFIENKLIEQIRKSPVYIFKSNAYKCDWSQEENLIRKLLSEIQESSVYQLYLANEVNDYASDQEFLAKIYKKKIASNNTLHNLCDDKSIYWASDYDSVCFWVLQSIKNMQEDNDEAISVSFIPTDENGKNEDIEYAKLLLQKTILHQDEYDKIIFDRLQNWDAERVALIELIILKTAVAEFINFPSIPIKVTLNEYIEVSKRFCSEKSRSFVNGLLNKIAIDLQEEKLIKKSGR